MQGQKSGRFVGLRARMLLVLVALLLAPVLPAFSGSYNMIMVDGAVGEWRGNELVARESTDDADFGTNNNLDRLFVTWDSNKLYLRVQGEFDSGGGNGFVIFLDTKYGSGNGVNSPADLADSSGALDALITNPNFSDTDSAFRADYALGSFQRSGVTSNTTNDAAGLRGWGSPDAVGGGATNNFAFLQGADVAVMAGTPDEAEFSVTWNALYGGTQSVVPTDAVLGIVVGYGSTGGGTGAETLPTNGAGNPGTFSDVYVVDIDTDASGLGAGIVDVGVHTGSAALADNSEAAPTRPNSPTTYTSAKTMDAVLDDWHQNEFVGRGVTPAATPSLMNYFLTWDATNIYVAFAGVGSGTGDRFNVLIDTNPLATDDNMLPFAGAEFNNNYEPDYAYQWNGANLNKFQASGANWSDVADDGSGADVNATPTIVELTIPRSGIGSPTGPVSFYLYVSNASDADYDALGNTPNNSSNLVGAAALAPAANVYGNPLSFPRLDPGVTVNQVGSLGATMASMEAQAQPDHVVVQWETASELNNAGFNVYRATSADGARSQINGALIPSKVPGGSGGATYALADYNVSAGATYFYWVEDVDTEGRTNLHGPVSITFSSPTALTLDRFQAEAGTGGAMAVLAALAAGWLLAMRARRG